VVDGFAAPSERYSKLKPPTRHRLETPDAFALMNKLVEFANEFRSGVVVVDSLNEVVMRSPGSALDLFRAFKIFSRSTDSMVVATAHTDVEEVHGVMATAEHLADVILQIEGDPNLEEMGLVSSPLRLHFKAASAGFLEGRFIAPSPLATSLCRLRVLYSA
jgi:RecA-superfamily ATPases implicated in signal transduction